MFKVIDEVLSHRQEAATFFLKEAGMVVYPMYSPNVKLYATCGEYVQLISDGTMAIMLNDPIEGLDACLSSTLDQDFMEYRLKRVIESVKEASDNGVSYDKGESISLTEVKVFRAVEEMSQKKQDDVILCKVGGLLFDTKKLIEALTILGGDIKYYRTGRTTRTFESENGKAVLNRYEM